MKKNLIAIALLSSSLLTMNASFAMTQEEMTALNQQHAAKIAAERQARRAALIAGQTSLPAVTRDTAHPTVRAYLNTPEAQAAAAARVQAAIAERQARRAALLERARGITVGPK